MTQPSNDTASERSEEIEALANRIACQAVLDYGEGDSREQDAAKAEALWKDHPAFQAALTALRSTTAATDNAAKDAEIAELRAALEGIIDHTYVGKAGQPVTNRSKWGNYPAYYYWKAVGALANRGEAGALEKERGE